MGNLRNPKNILVTGGAGFIGSAFIRYVLQKVNGFEGILVNYDVLTYAGNLDNLKEIDQDPRYVFHQGDIRNQALVDHFCNEYDIDTIIHFAAESHVDRSIEGPQAFVETNVLGTFHLLEVVRKNPRIHFHITRISNQPINAQDFYVNSELPKRVIYPGGYVVSGNQIYIAYGKDDHEVWIAVMDKHKLMRSLRQVQN